MNTSAIIVQYFEYSRIMQISSCSAVSSGADWKIYPVADAVANRCYTMFISSFAAIERFILYSRAD